MPKTISNVDFRRNFGEILDYVERTKRPVYITHHGDPRIILRHPSDSRCDNVASEAALKVRLELADRINTVHYQQRPLMITRRNRPIACFFPVDPPDPNVDR